MHCQVNETDGHTHFHFSSFGMIGHTNGLNFNPILHRLFQAGSIQGGGVHKVPVAFFAERLKLLQLNLVNYLIRPIPIN